jgi:hypothetical protein
MFKFIHLSFYLSIYLWLYSPLLGLGRFFSSMISYTVGSTPWTDEQPVARPLPAHRTVQTENKRRQTSMPQVGFEPTVPVSERAKTFHALDLAATVIYTARVQLPKNLWLWASRGLAARRTEWRYTVSRKVTLTLTLTLTLILSLVVFWDIYQSARTWARKMNLHR